MAIPPPTQRLAKNELDQRMMKVREEIASLTRELGTLPPGSEDRRVAMQNRIHQLKNELMASMKSTDKLV
jgi:hypothetical protein